MPSQIPSTGDASHRWRTALVTAHGDRRVWHQARALLAAGWQAEIFPARDLETLAVPADLPRFDPPPESPGAMAGRRLRTRLYALATSLGLRFAGPLYQTLRAVFCPVAENTIARHQARLVAGEYRMLLAHDLPVLPLCVTVAATTRARVLYDSHELYSEQSGLSARARRYWEQVEKTYIGRADFIVTVNQGIAEELARRYSLPRLPMVLPNVCSYRPLPDDRSALSRLYGLPPSRPLVLCQGGLMPGRGLETVVEAWECFPKTPPLLVFLGDGPMAAWIARRVRQRKLQDHVFVGRSVASDELLRYTACADLGLIPYAPGTRVTCPNTRLSSPNRLFEYVMARVPILTWELPEIKRVMDEAGTGWCATWRSPRELAARIQEALGKVAHISTEAREAAARRFSLEHYQPEWLTALSDLREQDR
jgi:glycosyltransferase involved in cell wall biosynthesis